MESITGKEEGFCRGEREEEMVTVSGVRGRLVVGIYTCDVAGGGFFGGWSGGEREGERNCKNGAAEAGFLSTLDPIFPSLRPSMEPLFIGGERG